MRAALHIHAPDFAYFQTGRRLDMALLKKASTVAVLASAAVVGAAGVASACGCQLQGGAGQGSDNTLKQGGIIPVNLANNVNLSPNLGCLANQTLPNVAAGGVAGVVPVSLDLSHLLEHANLNVLANGNNTTEIDDHSCTSNQGSSQSGNNSHGSTGAGSSSNVSNNGNNAGSHNSGNGKGAGGLLGETGILGTGL